MRAGLVGDHLDKARLDAHAGKVMHQRREGRGEVQAEIVVVERVSVLKVRWG